MSETLNNRQAQIREVATRLFAEHGYRAVGMRAIADGVGVRTSTLYHHFASKQEILYSIGLGVTADFVQAHLPLLDGPGDETERVGALLRAHVIYFARHRVAQAVARRERRELSPEHVREVRRHEGDYQRRIQQFLAAGTASGAFHVEDPALAGLAVIDMVNGINVWYRPDGPLSIEEIADRYVGLVLGLLGAERPTPASQRRVS
jgi:AcrR family transcriptional regulator